jgi:GT2 family glycosyltransferase
MKERVVTIVIPYFNQIDYLLQTLRAVAENPSAGFRSKIILFDNASDEQLDTRILDALGLDWQLFRNETNQSVSKPWNHGIRLGFEDHSADAVCLLNSDVIVGEGWIEHCVAALDEGAYCTFPVAYTDGGPLPKDFGQRAKLASAGRLAAAFDNLPVRRQHRPGENYYGEGNWFIPEVVHTKHETDGFCGYCFFVSRECIEAIGYIDEQMTLCYSDTDYRNRLITAGRPPVCVHRCFTHHYGSRTIRPLLDTPRQVTTIENDKLYFEQKWDSEYDRLWRNHCVGRNQTA